jgi:hypothetical protein
MPPRVTARQTHIADRAAREIRFTLRKAPRSPTSSASHISDFRAAPPFHRLRHYLRTTPIALHILADEADGDNNPT